MFIKLARDGITLGNRTYPAGSVVEVEKNVRKALVERGHAADADGPAFEPTADEGKADEGKAERSAKFEKAARR